MWMAPNEKFMHWIYSNFEINKKNYLKALLSCFFSNPAGPVPPPETDPDRRPEVEDIEDVDVERLELAV